LKKTLFTSQAIKKLKEEIAPRFKNLPAGFTRISYIGRRNNDKAQAAYIELLGNPIEEYEKNEEALEKEEFGLQSYWEWESNLLEQEKDFFEEKLRDLKAQIDVEVVERLQEEDLQNPTAQIVGDGKSRALEIRSDIDVKYAAKKKFLLEAWDRAKIEGDVHEKQKDRKRYQKMYHQYAYPINGLKFKEDEKIKPLIDL